VTMDPPQPIDPPLHWVGQRLVSGDRVRKDGIAERLAVAMRHLLRIKQRAAARPAAGGSVGMPSKAGIGGADMLVGFVADIGNKQDLREPGNQVLLDDMNFQLSEPRAEFYVPLVG